MGCDIHTMAEIRRKSKEVDKEEYNQVWEVLTFPNPYYGKYEWEKSQETLSPFTDRNYKLFGFLADVRNGYGFAGVDTGDAIKPIDEPRGVPENASKEWKAYCWDWGQDLHSMSYFTLAELKGADWDQPVIARMYVSPEDYAKFKKTGNVPDMGWGASNQKEVTAKEYEAMPDEDKALVHGVQIEYSKPMRWYGDNFLDMLKKLEKIAKTEKVSEDEVRLVFGFDN